MNMPLHKSDAQPEQHCESHYHWLHPHSTHTEFPCKDNKKHYKPSQIPFSHLQIKHCIQLACPIQTNKCKRLVTTHKIPCTSTLSRVLGKGWGSPTDKNLMLDEYENTTLVEMVLDIIPVIDSTVFL